MVEPVNPDPTRVAQPPERGDASATRAGARAPREQLLARHAEARHRRDAAALGGPDWAAATAEIGRIEVEIARLEREMDPPRV